MDDEDVLLGDFIAQSGLVPRDEVSRALGEVGRLRARGQRTDLRAVLLARGIDAARLDRLLADRRRGPPSVLGQSDAPAPPPAPPRPRAPSSGQVKASPEAMLPVVTAGKSAKWGRYEITAEVARGAMGAVYRAKDTRRGGHEVALKVLLQGRAEGEDLERFKREARSLARLGHPSIVRVYDFGLHEGCPYITMDFVAGTTLESLLKGGDLPLARGLVIIEEVARAVDHAHGRGVVHRDLKPANILIGADGRARITDFGLAKILEEGQSLTRAGDMIGTPLYMSPEQVRGELTAVGPSCDVWSLGVTLYLLLTGEQPFGGKTVESVAKRVLDENPAPPRRLRPDVAPDLERICLTALEKDPKRRYQSAGEMSNDLSSYLHGRPVLAGHVTPGMRIRRGLRKARIRLGTGPLVAIAIAVAVVAVAAVLAITARGDPAPDAGLAAVEARVAQYEKQAPRAAHEHERALGAADAVLRELDALAAAGRGSSQLRALRGRILAIRVRAVAGQWQDDGPAATSLAEAVRDAPSVQAVRALAEAAARRGDPELAQRAADGVARLDQAAAGTTLGVPWSLRALVLAVSGEPRGALGLCRNAEAQRKSAMPVDPAVLEEELALHAALDWWGEWLAALGPIDTKARLPQDPRRLLEVARAAREVGDDELRGWALEALGREPGRLDDTLVRGFARERALAALDDGQPAGALEILRGDSARLYGPRADAEHVLAEVRAHVLLSVDDAARSAALLDDTRRVVEGKALPVALRIDAWRVRLEVALARGQTTIADQARAELARLAVTTRGPAAARGRLALLEAELAAAVNVVARRRVLTGAIAQGLEPPLDAASATLRTDAEGRRPPVATLAALLAIDGARAVADPKQREALDRARAAVGRARQRESVAALRLADWCDSGQRGPGAIPGLTTAGPNDDTPRAVVDLTRRAHQLGGADDERALRLLDIAARFAPLEPHVLRGRAELLLDTVARRPDDPRAPREAAVLAAAAAVALDPHGNDARRTLARSLVIAGDARQAEAWGQTLRGKGGPIGDHVLDALARLEEARSAADRRRILEGTDPARPSDVVQAAIDLFSATPPGSRWREVARELRR